MLSSTHFPCKCLILEIQGTISSRNLLIGKNHLLANKEADQLVKLGYLPLLRDFMCFNLCFLQFKKKKTEVSCRFLAFII